MENVTVYAERMIAMGDIKKAMDVFSKRGFDVSFFETKEQATEYLKGKISYTTVAFGGSETLAQMGLFEVLSEKNIVSWHSHAESKDVRALSRQCKIYISSVNAITETGEIINIDSSGNRISSTLFGHEKVYFVVGVNKVSPDLSSGLYRAKNIAAPMNARKLNRKTPCAVKGDKCYDCDSPDRICRATCIMERNMTKTNYEIIFINENLGY